FSRTDLQEIRELKLLKTAEAVGTMANENLAALKDYGVTTADIEVLNVARVTFARLDVAAREAWQKRVAAAKAIPELLSSVHRIFKKEIDRMVARTKEGYPD